MKVTVLSGSPEGKDSITLQSVLYLQKKFKEDQFMILDVGSRIRSLQKDFTPVLAVLSEADLVLFAYPVYIFLAPSQLQTAIALLKQAQREGKVDLRGKCMAQISTSKHFYDVTAAKYICDNARDLGMVYLRGLTADMDDLLSEKGRNELESFWDFVHFRFRCETQKEPLTGSSDQKNYDVVVVTDCHEDPELAALIEEFKEKCMAPVRIANIYDFGMKGGCLGCFHCTEEGQCVYKEGFKDFLPQEIREPVLIDTLAFLRTMKTT